MWVKTLNPNYVQIDLQKGGHLGPGHQTINYGCFAEHKTGRELVGHPQVNPKWTVKALNI